MPVVPQPPDRFIQVPPNKLREVRTRSTLIGTTLIAVSLGICVVVVPWTFGLPTSYDPLTFLVAAMLAVSSLFSSLTGALALAGLGCVRTGQLNITSCGNLRRGALLFWIGTAVTSGLGFAAMVLVVATSSGSTWHPPVDLGPEMLSFLGLLLLPSIVGCAALIAMHRTLRP